MREVNQIYKCNVCGNIVEMVHGGVGELVCCGLPMELKKEQKDEKGLTEKHRPIIENKDDGATIKIGSIPHPMEKEHYIEWVEVITKTKNCRYILSAGDKPEIRSYQKDHSYVRAYCNIHGLWKNQ